VAGEIHFGLAAFHFGLQFLDGLGVEGDQFGLQLGQAL
jgi:hypothetical protein